MDGCHQQQSAANFCVRHCKALQDDEVPVIKRLLEHGADPNGLYGGSTPLMMVRSEAAARSVLAAGGDPRALDANGQTPLFKAAYLAPAVTDVFLKAGVPPYQPDVNGHTALSQAACAGNAGAVELLLARGRDSAWRPSAEAALKCARESQPYERLYQQHLIDTDPAFIKSFDAVIALLEQALAKGPRK
jgi:ankyrin repeat protein